MPIHVEHGGQAGTVAGQIIAQGGQRNLDRQQHDAHFAQQLYQQRDLAMLHIDAQADLQRQAADDAMKRTALQFGLQQQLQEQEYDTAIRRMQEQARLDANQFEYRYSAQQRQEIARFNNARQTILGSDQFTPQEKQIALRLIDQQQANIQPSAMPRDPGKPVFPEGQGIGQAWVDKNGSLIGRKADGSLQLLQRWDQGPEAAQAKAQEAEKVKALELQAKREEKLLELRLKLATEDVAQRDAKGGVAYRQRTPKEIDAIMQSVAGGETADPAQEQWWHRAEKSGLKVTAGDRQLPDQVGYARALVRTINERGAIPKEQELAYREAVDILTQYQTQKGAQ
ncbi:MAG: hypothetical protein ACOY3P_21680 [Planctomycetota bacterium]